MRSVYLAKFTLEIYELSYVNVWLISTTEIYENSAEQNIKIVAWLHYRLI